MNLIYDRLNCIVDAVNFCFSFQVSNGNCIFIYGIWVTTFLWIILFQIMLIIGCTFGYNVFCIFTIYHILMSKKDVGNGMPIMLNIVFNLLWYVYCESLVLLVIIAGSMLCKEVNIYTRWFIYWPHIILICAGTQNKYPIA